MDDEPDYTKFEYRRMLSEKNQRINELGEENQKLRELERHNFRLYTKSNETAMKLGEEVFELKKELRRRWERIKELSEKVTHYEKCDKARIDGLNACLAGKTINDNPFKENPDDLYFEYWSIGFLDIWNGMEQERRLKELREELTHLRKQIKDVVDLVGDRYEEQGRVMMAFKVLEGIVEEEEDE